MPGMERITVPIEWKASADDSGTLEGYASTFGNVDLGGDVVMPGAFKKTIANIKANGIPLLADHIASTASVLGTIYDAKEDANGLHIKAKFSSAPSAQDVRVKLVEGHLKTMSIGYESMDDAYSDTKDGQRVRLLKELKLWETSVVVFPMNPEAVVSRVKSLAGSLDAEARKALAADIVADRDTQDSPDDRGEQLGDEPGVGEPDEGSQQAGDEPADGASDEGAHWDRWASEALLAGNDPDAVADPATVAGLRTLLELNEAALGLGSADTETE